MPTAPIGAKTGSPAAPSTRYSAMLAAPGTGPSIMPARTTSSGCSVSGTGVPGSGMATCDAAASAMTKPTAPKSARVRSCLRESESVVMSGFSGNTEGHRVAASEAERRDTGSGATILHGVQQSCQHARAARADRMAERDRAAVHVHAIPVPAQLLAVGQCLRRERFVGFDEIVVRDLAARLLHEVLHCVDGRKEQVLRFRGARRVP